MDQRSSVGGLRYGDLCLLQLHGLSVVPVSVPGVTLVEAVVSLRQSVNLNSPSLQTASSSTRAYPESGQSGGWSLVKVSNVEVIVTLHDLSVPLPVDGGCGEAVHQALEEDLVARGLPDPGPGDADLGPVADDEVGGHVLGRSHRVGGNTLELASVGPVDGLDPNKVSLSS